MDGRQATINGKGNGEAIWKLCMFSLHSEKVDLRKNMTSRTFVQILKFFYRACFLPIGTILLDRADMMLEFGPQANTDQAGNFLFFIFCVR